MPVAIRQANRGYYREFPRPKTLPFGSPQAIDSQAPAWADFAAQDQMFVGGLPSNLSLSKHEWFARARARDFLGSPMAALRFSDPRRESTSGWFVERSGEAIVSRKVSGCVEPGERMASRPSTTVRATVRDTSKCNNQKAKICTDPSSILFG